MNNREIVLKVLNILPKTKEIFDTVNIEVEEKDGTGNFVTSVDKKLENYFKKTLLEIFSTAQIIAEESAEEVKKIDDFKLKFVIDPLDGTTNYTNGWPHATSIGIVNNNEIIGGIIYEVLENRVYVGIKDEGVYESNINNILNLKKIRKPIYDRSSIKKTVISYDIPYGSEAFEQTKEMCSKLYYDGASLKAVGPIALDILKMALGKENRPKDYNSATWHMEVRAWDLAGVTCILRELGGEIIGKDGLPLSIETLTSPSEKITFFASGNEALRNELFKRYNEIVKI